LNGKSGEVGDAVGVVIVFICLRIVTMTGSENRLSASSQRCDNTFDVGVSLKIRLQANIPFRLDTGSFSDPSDGAGTGANLSIKRGGNMKVIGLNAPMLNFWVAKSLGVQPITDGRSDGTVSVLNVRSEKLEPFQPTIDWSQAGPILADEWHELESMMIEWFGPLWPHAKEFRESPLTWLMRAFVALRFGDEVEDWPGCD
jgi:hypothetical protein